MQRYNIFYRAHQGLRAMLHETSLLLQHADFGNEKERNQVKESLEQASDMFVHHAKMEDGIIFPALEPYEPAVTDAFNQEHVEDERLGEELRRAALFLQHTEGKDLVGLREETIRIFEAFAAFNITHMAKEEKILNPLLWRYYTDDHLNQLTGKITAAVPPAMALLMSRWMIKGLTNPEIISWMLAVKNKAPEPVFAELMAVAETELPDHRWLSIREGLTEGALLA